MLSKRLKPGVGAEVRVLVVEPGVHVADDDADPGVAGDRIGRRRGAMDLGLDLSLAQGHVEVRLHDAGGLDADDPGKVRDLENAIAGDDGGEDGPGLGSDLHPERLELRAGHVPLDQAADPGLRRGTHHPLNLVHHPRVVCDRHAGVGVLAQQRADLLRTRGGRNRPRQENGQDKENDQSSTFQH